MGNGTLSKDKQTFAPSFEMPVTVACLYQGLELLFLELELLSQASRLIVICPDEWTYFYTICKMFFFIEVGTFQCSKVSYVTNIINSMQCFGKSHKGNRDMKNIFKTILPTRESNCPFKNKSMIYPCQNVHIDRGLSSVSLKPNCSNLNICHSQCFQWPSDSLPCIYYTLSTRRSLLTFTGVFLHPKTFSKLSFTANCAHCFERNLLNSSARRDTDCHTKRIVHPIEYLKT